MKTYWKEIGQVGVDSGLLMIVDPCYVLREEGEKLNTTYDEMIDDMEGKGIKNVNFTDIAGDGLVFSTAYGDGTYPVMGKFTIDEFENEVMIEIKVKLD